MSHQDWRSFCLGTPFEIALAYFGEITCRGQCVVIERVDSERIETTGTAALDGVDGILVAPGFGARGVDGKLAAIRYARERGVPFLGICFGMQLAIVEFARNVCGLAGAMSTEVVRKRQACGLTQPLDMYVKRHEYFRWTPRTTWITLVYVAIVPSAFLYLAYRTEVSDGSTYGLAGMC